MTMPEVGDRFCRKSDGKFYVVIEEGGGSHSWFDLKPEDGGRTTTLSASGIARKFDRVEFRVGTEVRKNPPGYPNHSMTGRILNAAGNVLEVKWENNTITYEMPTTIEVH